jgi:hypothetical protein
LQFSGALLQTRKVSLVNPSSIKKEKSITCKLFSYPMSASNLHKSHLTFVKREREKKRKEKQESILSSGCLSDGLR